MSQTLFKVAVKSPHGARRLMHVKADIEVDDKNFILRFPYVPDLVKEIGAMKGARWNPDEKYWTAPLCERNEYAIRYLEGWRDDSVTAPPLPIHQFSRPLFKHQEEGVAKILHTRRGMLAFEMGLGKTLACIEIMERAPSISSSEADRLIWWLVAPYGAQQEWKRQLIRWKSAVRPTIITTYESLHKHLDAASEPPDGVIFDESIKIKNPNAQRSQVASELCRLIRAAKPQAFIILLSGAPAPKEPTDWWHQIECIYPGWLREGDIYKFRKRYANLELVDEGYGTFYKLISWREDEVKKLGARLAPIVLVKHKKDCMDLPAKIFDPIECKPNENTVRVAALLLQSSATGIEALEKLRELSDGFQYTRKTNVESSGDIEYEDNSNEQCNSEDTSNAQHISRNNSNRSGYKNYTWIGSAKLTIVKELLDFYHTENGGPGRLVIYAAFHATIDKLCEFVQENKWSYGRIDGRGWSNENILDEMDINSGMDNYCIIANPACCHGLSFTSTECLCYYSNSFSVDHRIQSLDRRDRPGMDETKGTRIVDLLNLSTDRLILEKLNKSMALQSITLEEIKRWLSLKSV